MVELKLCGRIYAQLIYIFDMDRLEATKTLDIVVLAVYPVVQGVAAELISKRSIDETRLWPV